MARLIAPASERHQGVHVELRDISKSFGGTHALEGGTLFIALIGNGFVLLGLNPLYEQITLGGILLIAVGADAWSRLRTR